MLPNKNGEYLALQFGTNRVYPVHFTIVVNGGRWSLYNDPSCTKANASIWRAPSLAKSVSVSETTAPGLISVHYEPDEPIFYGKLMDLVMYSN